MRTKKETIEKIIANNRRGFAVHQIWAMIDKLESELATINAERAETRDIRKEMIKAQDEVAKLRAALDETEGALKWWQELKRESCGVAGYHMNGDVAEWDELDDPTEAALARIAAARSGKADTSDSPTDS